jgi:protein tyrosine phosphatase (PTP) superfamily phosphohydrolase (DUF442 family)
VTQLAGVEGILNWHPLDARVTTSGQPSEAELELLQSLGIRHVINLGLHSHEKALPDEAGTLAGLGLGYSHIPVPFLAPAEADFAQFRAVFEAMADVPVHVHCIMNYRVSAFFYRYRRQMLGWNAAQALPDLLKIWQPTPVWGAFIDLEGQG